MSHFSVLVITPEKPTETILERLLAPFHEFECTGADNEYVQSIDITKEALARYAAETKPMLHDPQGMPHYRYDDRFHRDPTPAEDKKLGKFAGTGTMGGLSFTSKDWGDGRGYRAKVRFVPDGWKEVDVPASGVQTPAEFVKDHYGYGAVEQEESIYKRCGGVMTIADKYKYGYAVVAADGTLVKVVDRTNPGAKWDWWQVGGRFTGMLVPHYDPSKDPANRETCRLCGGSGKRDDALGREARAKDPAYGCNGCDGTGVETKWPTSWKKIVGDVVQLKDVPLEALRNIAEREALNTYDKAQAVIAGRQIPSWKETRERVKDIEAARAEFNGCPVMKDLSKAFGFIWDADSFLDGLRATRNEYAVRARRAAIQTFAVLKDGRWYEQGEMGWWGLVRDEKDPDRWSDEFSALLDKLPGETWLAVVDCHI